MYISILGRQPAIGAAELERLYGSKSVAWFSSQCVTIKSPDFDFERLGGSQKAGRVILELPRGDWRAISTKIIQHYSSELSRVDYKVTLGISVYGFDVSTRDIQKTGIILKQKLRKSDVSLRLLPNAEPALNTAASHHNKLGLSPNKIELLIVRSPGGRTIVAESVGAQNITALAARDQARPHTDAFVGMLPPKLARMMVNMTTVVGVELPSLAKQSAARASNDNDRFDARSEAVSPDVGSEAPAATSDSRPLVILDPFCGTGVILQEALLLGFDVYGTDLSEKMVDYSTKNIAWLKQRYTSASDTVTIELGDAQTHKWQGPIGAIACETYLGQPFSAPPSPAKLAEVRETCTRIVGEFLYNISSQITPGTVLCVAVPAWRDKEGRFTHLPLIGKFGELGYDRYQFNLVRDSDLLYYRENQVVARELLVLTKR